MIEHFFPCKLPWTQGGQTWSTLHRGQEVRSQMDYILGTDRFLFQIVAVHDPMNNTGNFMVLGCLHVVILRYHQCYLRSRTQIPIYPPNRPSHEDTLFASLRKAVAKTPVCERTHTSWILEETWRVIGTSVSLCISPYRSQRRLCALSCQVWSLLNGDRRRRVTEE